MLPKSEQNWRSNETINFGHKNRKLPPKKYRKSGHVFEEQLEAPRVVRSESEWVMKVTDKWGQGEIGSKRKRMLFSKRAEEQTQWVVGMTDKCREQREC